MHEFIKIDCPAYVKLKGFMISAKICNNCKLVVTKQFANNKYYDYFFIDEVEEYRHLQLLEELELTCDELIIKNILE